MDMSLLLLLLVIATFIVPNHAFGPFGLKDKIDGFNKRTKGRATIPMARVHRDTRLGPKNPPQPLAKQGRQVQEPTNVRAKSQTPSSNTNEPKATEWGFRPIRRPQPAQQPGANRPGPIRRPVQRQPQAVPATIQPAPTSANGAVPASMFPLPSADDIIDLSSEQDTTRKVHRTNSSWSVD